MANPFDKYDQQESNPFDRFDKEVEAKPSNPFDKFDVKDDPSVGDIAKGLAAEVAIGESAKYAGAKSGARRGPYGALVGYVVGGI